VLDGKLVALNADGQADFNMLQNFKSAERYIHYYAFDVLMHKGESLIGHPLVSAQSSLGGHRPAYRARREHGG
jgi:ATP-dependent DNA ligase